MSKTTPLTEARWWAKAACQNRETMSMAITANDATLYIKAERAYTVAKRHMWESLDKLTPRQRKCFDSGIPELLRLHGLAAI
jgi:hypothetical protein